MNLINRYSNHSIEDLVNILESGTDYTEEAKNAVKTILELKEVPEKELKEIATTIWRKKIALNIKSILFKNEIPESYFLSFEDLKPIMLEAFDDYREKQGLFEIDTTKYWFV